MTTEKCSIMHMPHHVQLKLCETRPPYRQGKKLTSIKVYTINDESQHLLICGIPKLQLEEEVKKLIYCYGDIRTFQLVTEYPSEDMFTQTFYVCFKHIQSARIAKRFIDNKNFFGGLLHVFYVPELETISETKAKLAQRHKEVAERIKINQRDLINLEVDKFIPRKQYHRKKKAPALPLDEERLKHYYPKESLLSVHNEPFNNIHDLQSVFLPVNSNNNHSINSNILFDKKSSSLNQSTQAIMPTKISPKENLNMKICKKKNYKGQCINSNVKVRIIRPQLINIKDITCTNIVKETNISYNVKKIKSNTTIKLLEKSESKTKKIVIKDPNVTRLIRCNEDLQCSIQAAKSEIRRAMLKIHTGLNAEVTIQK